VTFDNSQQTIKHRKKLISENLIMESTLTALV